MSIFDSREFNERLFFPRPDESDPPAGAEDHFVEVPGARLHWRWHRSPARNAVVLFFHGNAEVVADYDDIARSFAEAGAELAVVDFRGYGRSTGTPTLRTAIEDAPRVLAAVRAKHRGRLVVMGRSIGSASATEIYGREPIELVRESGFVDLVGLVKRRELVPPAQLDGEVFDPIPKLRRGTGRLLVLHGAEDTLIHPREAEAAYDAAGTSDKTLVEVPGRGHNDLSLHPAYWAALARFLE